MQLYCNSKCNKLVTRQRIDIMDRFLYFSYLMFIDNAISLLKSHDQKITKTRLWLLERIGNIKSPLNPYELIGKDPQATIDITTIYRNLELFEKIGIVHKIASLWWYMPCLHQHAHCGVHDMIICNSCHSITETHIDPYTKKSLWLSEWAVELSGKCSDCQKKKNEETSSSLLQ